MASTFLESYKIVITRFFFPVLYFELLRKIYGTYDQIFGTCASINNKNRNYKPGKSFSTQNHLLILSKKNTGENVITQGKLRENTGNFMSAGMWPPCTYLHIFSFSMENFMGKVSVEGIGNPGQKSIDTHENFFFLVKDTSSAKVVESITNCT